jgi:hypothetical protein
VFKAALRGAETGTGSIGVDCCGVGCDGCGRSGVEGALGALEGFHMSLENPFRGIVGDQFQTRTYMTKPKVNIRNQNCWIGVGFAAFSG